MLSLYDLGWLLLSFVFSSLLSDAPQVSLRLGRTLDADNIRTGHDVYFECDVKANPPALRLEWLHNVSIEFFSVKYFYSFDMWKKLPNEIILSYSKYRNSSLWISCLQNYLILKIQIIRISSSNLNKCLIFKLEIYSNFRLNIFVTSFDVLFYFHFIVNRLL